MSINTRLEACALRFVGVCGRFAHTVPPRREGLDAHESVVQESCVSRVFPCAWSARAGKTTGNFARAGIVFLVMTLQPCRGPWTLSLRSIRPRKIGPGNFSFISAPRRPHPRGTPEHGCQRFKPQQEAMKPMGLTIRENSSLSLNFILFLFPSILSYSIHSLLEKKRERKRTRVYEFPQVDMNI